MAEDQDTMDEWAAAMAEAEGGDAKTVDLEELKDEKGNKYKKHKWNGEPIQKVV